MVCGISYFFPVTVSTLQLGICSSYPSQIPTVHLCTATSVKNGPRGSDGIGVPSRRQTVVRSLPEESADTLHSHARIIPCFTSLNSKLIGQTALVALSGVSCNATLGGLRVVSIPTNSPASLADS